MNASLPTPSLTRRAALFGAAGITAAGALASCGKGGSGGSGGQNPVRIHANDVNKYERNFNLYSPSAPSGPAGLIFEPLMITTSMDAKNPVPWVAESITFNEDGTAAEIAVRDGIVFTDDKPLTADDVVFSLLLLRDQPATNGSALPITDAVKKDEKTVTVSFDGPSFAFAPTLGLTYIVPKHIFEKIDPVKDAISDPVGSGPYMLDKFSDQLYTFKKNEKHWAADEFTAEQLHFPAYTTETFTTALQQGEIDWSGGFVANVDKIFVDKDPEHRGHWYPGLGVVNLTFNLEHPLFQDLELRRGINYAIDRERIAKVAMSGYVPAPNPTALPTPTFDDYISEQYKGLAFEFDAAKAEQTLDAAGYRKGDDGVRVAPDGTRLEFPLQIPSAYVDWVSVTQILDESLSAIGVKFTPQGVSEDVWIEARNGGNFEVTLSIVSAGINPWFMYRSMLSSRYKTEDGSVRANFQRWYDDETDELLAAYTRTDDQAEQQKAIDGLETIMVEKMPALPIVVAPNWFNYNTVNWSGFPSEKDPYALGAPYSSTDRILVLRKLKPTEG